MMTDADLAVLAAVAGTALAWALLVMVRRWLRKRRWQRRPLWLSGYRGTVYVFQDYHKPEIIKVGTTKRLSKIRKREVSRRMAYGRPLRQVFAIDMMHAATVEFMAHRTLPRSWRQPWWRGREWYKLRHLDELPIFLKDVEACAWEVRSIAQKNQRWNSNNEIMARRWRLVEGKGVRELLFKQR